MSTPTVLFFSEGGPTAEVYREYLPAGWCLETLDRRDDEAEKLVRLSRANVLIHSDVPLTAAHLDAASGLRLIQRQGVGYDALDLDAAEARGIPVCLCPVGTAEAVAEHTIMLMLAVGRHLGEVQNDMRAGGWPKWAYRDRALGLTGTRVGLVGFGRIGQAVAERLLPFGAQVLVARSGGRDPGGAWLARGVEAATDLDEVFRRSAIVSLHCPLTPETEGLVDRRRLGLMDERAILINTARGALVVEDDLVDVLRAGGIAGAGLDVLAQEPAAPDHPLRALPMVLLTPHHAAGTRTAQRTKAQVVIANAIAVLSGDEPRFRLR